MEDGKDAKPWFDPAAADFKKAVERDGRHYMALDMLGLFHEQTGELDKAIGDFTQEMTLNPLGRARLADAYCAPGSSNQKEKKYDAAIADYEKAIEIGATADGCSCDPYDPLVALYDGVSRRYDKGWAPCTGNRPHGLAKSASIPSGSTKRVKIELDDVVLIG